MLAFFFFTLVACDDSSSANKKETCDNQLDDDGDSYIDCEDQDCWSDAACKQNNTNNTNNSNNSNNINNTNNTNNQNIEICDDQTDNDNDGFVDCNDNDCVLDPACQGSEICDNQANIGCNPIDQIGCEPTQACYVDAQTPDGYCAAPGTTDTGTRCVDHTDCIPGDACVGPQNNRVCRILCVLGTNTCPQGTNCQASPMLTGTPYGVCR